MNPNTVQLITFIEGMVALVAKSVVDLKSVMAGSSKPVTDILAEADAAYQQVIATANQGVTSPASTPPLTGGTP